MLSVTFSTSGVVVFAGHGGEITTLTQRIMRGKAVSTPAFQEAIFKPDFGFPFWQLLAAETTVLSQLPRKSGR
jgi:hypothetical protein